MLNESQGKLEALKAKSTAPRKRRSRRTANWIAELIITLHTNHPRLGKAKLNTLLASEGYTGSISTIGRILNDLNVTKP